MTSNTLDQAEPPRLAAGVRLLGPLEDSGFADPPSLLRRGDGQVIQLPRMMYLVALLMDGIKDPEEIALLASADLGRTLSADQVRYLIDVKLAPLGIVAGPADGADSGPADAGPGAAGPVSPARRQPSASPLLALRARVTLLPEPAAAAAGTLLRPLFHWPVIAVVVIATGVLDYWVLTISGLSAGLRQLLANPVDLLLVAALTIVSALFHECGHAAGCRYGGGRPGRIGAGLYLFWPSFFTDVTDSYRLSRGGRLRTDLGGLYFNLIFILVLAGVYAASSTPLLLLVIVIGHLEILQQLLPVVRFDGYFILSDLVGVPDLFNRVVPVVRDTLSRAAAGGRDPRAAGLRRPARIVITAWVLLVVPLLLTALGYLLLRLPAADRALWHSAQRATDLARASLSGHHYAAAAADALGAALAAASVAGTLYLLAGLVRRALAGGWRWSAGRPRRRLAAAAALAACAAALILLWLATGQLRNW